MNVRLLIIMAALGSTLVAAPAFAQLKAQTSQADQDACQPDVLRLCGEAIPDEGKIVACLTKNKAKLSPTCKTVMSRKR